MDKGRRFRCFRMFPREAYVPEKNFLFRLLLRWHRLHRNRGAFCQDAASPHGRPLLQKQEDRIPLQEPFRHGAYPRLISAGSMPYRQMAELRKLRTADVPHLIRSGAVRLRKPGVRISPGTQHRQVHHHFQNHWSAHHRAARCLPLRCYVRDSSCRLLPCRIPQRMLPQHDRPDTCRRYTRRGLPQGFRFLHHSGD